MTRNFTCSSVSTKGRDERFTTLSSRRLQGKNVLIWSTTWDHPVDRSHVLTKMGRRTVMYQGQNIFHNHPVPSEEVQISWWGAVGEYAICKLSLLLLEPTCDTPLTTKIVTLSSVPIKILTAFSLYN